MESAIPEVGAGLFWFGIWIFPEGAGCASQEKVAGKAFWDSSSSVSSLRR